MTKKHLSKATIILWPQNFGKDDYETFEWIIDIGCDRKMKPKDLNLLVPWEKLTPF